MGNHSMSRFGATVAFVAFGVCILFLARPILFAPKVSRLEIAIVILGLVLYGLFAAQLLKRLAIGSYADSISDAAVQRIKRRIVIRLSLQLLISTAGIWIIFNNPADIGVEGLSSNLTKALVLAIGISVMIWRIVNAQQLLGKLNIQSEGSRDTY